MSQSDSSSSSYEEVQDSHAVQDKITKMENSIRGFKGSLTRRINEAKSALLAAGARTVADVPESRSIDTQLERPTPYDVSALVECKNECLKHMTRSRKPMKGYKQSMLPSLMHMKQVLTRKLNEKTSLQVSSLL